MEIFLFMFEQIIYSKTLIYLILFAWLIQSDDVINV